MTGIGEIQGSNYDDVLTASLSNDLFFGEAGNDTIHAEASGQQDNNYSERLFGQTATDKLYGESGQDTLSGGPGDDLLDRGPMARKERETEAIAVKCLQALIGGDFPHIDKITSTKFRTWPPSSSVRLLLELSQAD